MTAPQRPFRRARNQEHKRQRADDLLNAARRLAQRGGVQAVTLTEIATDAGVHISAVRRYFESREDIFLRLAAAGWQDWASEVRARLITSSSASAGDAAQVLADTLAQRGLFCDLLAHAPLSLERAVSADVVRDFKLTALQAADEIAGCLVAAAPALNRAAARDLVATANALAGSLWQTANPPPALARLYSEDPRLEHAVVDFAPRLTRLLTATAEGLAVATHPIETGG